LSPSRIHRDAVVNHDSFTGSMSAGAL